MIIFLHMLPIMLIILVGYFCARFRLLSHDSNEHFTRYAFFIAMPAQLVFILSQMPFSEIINLDYTLAYIFTVILVSTSLFLVSKYVFKKSLAECALNMMGGALTNTAYFAIPIFILVLNNPAPIMPILFFQTVIMTTLILLMIEHDLNKKNLEKKLFKKIVYIFLQNPIIIASILGITFSFFKLHLPVFLNMTLGLIGSTASPLVLFALGQSLLIDLKKIEKREISEVCMLALTKSFIFPTLAFLMGKYIFDLSGFWLLSLALVAAMPTPKNMFIFSIKYNLDVKKASTVVAITTLLSFITLNFIFFVLK